MTTYDYKTSGRITPFIPVFDIHDVATLGHSVQSGGHQGWDHTLLCGLQMVSHYVRRPSALQRKQCKLNHIISCQPVSGGIWCDVSCVWAYVSRYVRRLEHRFTHRVYHTICPERSLGNEFISPTFLHICPQLHRIKKLVGDKTKRVTSLYRMHSDKHRFISTQGYLFDTCTLPWMCSVWTYVPIDSRLGEHRLHEK